MNAGRSKPFTLPQNTTTMSPPSRSSESARRDGAANVTLTPEDLRQIDEAASKITLVGERYPEAAQRMINR